MSIISYTPDIYNSDNVNLKYSRGENYYLKCMSYTLV